MDTIKLPTVKVPITSAKFNDDDAMRVIKAQTEKVHVVFQITEAMLKEWMVERNAAIWRCGYNWPKMLPEPTHICGRDLEIIEREYPLATRNIA